MLSEQLPGILDGRGADNEPVFLGRSVTGHRVMVTSYSGIDSEVTVSGMESYRTLISVRFQDRARAREAILAAAALLLSLVDDSPDVAADAVTLSAGVLP